MLLFLITLGLLILITLVLQLVMKMKLVPPSQLAVVHGKGGRFRTFRGGRVFVFPLVNRFNTMDLTPQTTTVVVESAIAAGIVPLTVKATVSYAVAKTERGLINAVKRMLHMTNNWAELQDIATSIIEGHLRDSIATMTPEEVMSHKDQLIQNMIKICKADLEGIGLEITTMNIADVDDHRLEGVEEPDLYIALLKRIQTANAESQSREAQANARASSKEQEEERRAEVTVRGLENERQQIEAETKVKIAEAKQHGAIDSQKETRDAESEVVGIHAQIEAETQRIEMVKAKCEADIIVPASATKEKMIQEAQAEAAGIRGQAQAELTQLKRTIEILQSGGEQGLTTYIIEKFGDLIEPFAQTLDLFPVDHITVISGEHQPRGPISAIHPNAVDAEINRLIGGVIAAAPTNGEHRVEDLDSVRWSYEGRTGPVHWGNLSPEFKLCKVGKRQSPIDITGAIQRDLERIQFHYQAVLLKMVHQNHTIQVNYGEGSSITVGNQKYDLLQFHFHAPSEHTVNGKIYDMEAHLVHQSQDGKLAVVAVFMQQGRQNDLIQTLWEHLPTREGVEHSIDNVRVNAKQMLPADVSYYTYSGSLTIPPGTEGVQWYVLKHPVEVSQEQISRFTSISKKNARPVQPLNGRVIQESR